MDKAAAKRVLVAELTSPHGVRGLMRLRSFAAEPADIFTYDVVENEAGATVKFAQRGVNKDLFIVAVDGIKDRNDADNWRHTKLYVTRDILGATSDDEFYVSDLQGLEARNTDGTVIGAVTRIVDYGSGPVLDIKRDGKGPLLILFTNSFVPEVHVDKGYIVINEPVEI